MSKTYKSEITAALHETISDLHAVGLVDHQTMKEFDESCLTTIVKLTPKEIKDIRENERASQTVFAHHLNVSPRVIEQWESGESAPSNTALKLLTLVKTKGLASIA